MVGIMQTTYQNIIPRFLTPPKMKIGSGKAFYLVICAWLLFPFISHADMLLEYQVKEIRVSGISTQSIAIKNEEIMVKAAGGDKGLDLLYRHAPESVVIIDHPKCTLTTVDEAQIDQINQQAQRLEPVLQGLGKQIANLSSDQRQRLQALVGDKISLDKIAKASEPAVPTRWESIGKKKVAGIRCRNMRIMQGATPIAEVCLADPAAMKMSIQDAATFDALFGFYDHLAAKSQGLARQLGLALPSITTPEVKGIPVEFVDLSRKNRGTMTLQRIDISPVSPDLMRVPGDYKTTPLTPWP